VLGVSREWAMAVLATATCYTGGSPRVPADAGTHPARVWPVMCVCRAAEFVDGFAGRCRRRRPHRPRALLPVWGREGTGTTRCPLAASERWQLKLRRWPPGCLYRKTNSHTISTHLTQRAPALLQDLLRGPQEGLQQARMQPPMLLPQGAPLPKQQQQQQEAGPLSPAQLCGLAGVDPGSPRAA